MDPFERVELGKTGIQVTRLGLGARGIVDPSVEVSDAEAVATVRTAYGMGIRYIDTSPRYGLGRSETFVGQGLAEEERDSYVLSTKVGRMLDPTADGGWYWDFSSDGVRRSHEESLGRLGLDRAEILFIHSPERHYDEAMAGAYPALAEVRAEGAIRAIGVGLSNAEIALRFAQEGDFDCFLLAGRYSLLDQSALPGFLPYCLENNIGVVIGGAYNSGILASDLGPDALYNYRVAPEEVLQKARRLSDNCQRHDVPLKAAALQFVMAHPAVTSVIPGSSFPGHVVENAAMLASDIPAALWDELRDQRLIDREAPVPG